MTLYYGIVFCLLVLESVLAILLVIPLPFTWRRNLFRFISGSPLIAKLQYSLKIVFIFVAILFVDAVQRMLRVQADGDRAKQQGGQMQDARSETNFAARKFYAQRNMYLTGFTLFLSLILSRVYSIILDLIKVQEDLAQLKKNAAGESRGKVLGGDEKSKYEKEIAELKKKLEANGSGDFGPTQSANSGVKEGYKMTDLSQKKQL